MSSEQMVEPTRTVKRLLCEKQVTFEAVIWRELLSFNEVLLIMSVRIASR